MQGFDRTDGWNRERSACGVGFLASLRGEWAHEHLRMGLDALSCVEHRGGCSVDQITADGAGIMTDIPFDLLGIEEGDSAIAMLFLPAEPGRRHTALQIFEDTFGFLGLEILRYRDVPVDPSVLGAEARSRMPVIRQAFIKRPAHCYTAYAFDKLLYNAKRTTRLKEKQRGLEEDFFFASLSAKTIVYKALVRSEALSRFFLDLQDPRYKTRFALFHRRFSTNTSPSWDKVQPFRLIGHNGEINTIAGNRAWGRAREMSLEANDGELLTHEAISDSGSLNEMMEALRYRSGVPHVEDILALMIPPADHDSTFYRFWSRAIEPWDGPAFVAFSEGRHVGARLDRNGFRPCRWAQTASHFFLGSEAGLFSIDANEIIAKGTLSAGRGVVVDLEAGAVMFRDPSQSIEHRGAHYDDRLIPLPLHEPLDQVVPTSLDLPQESASSVAAHPLLEEVASLDEAPEEESTSPLHRALFTPAAAQERLTKLGLFGYADEDIHMILAPMIASGKEAIGSMGDTARPAILSKEDRPLFDFFYQNFSQVTNPPLDYVREAMVTDIRVYLGRKPNIFQPKELIPPPPAFLLPSPILSLRQMEALGGMLGRALPQTRLAPYALEMTFVREHKAVGMRERLREMGKEAVAAIRQGYTNLILTDRSASYAMPPIPSLLALRAVIKALDQAGLRLRASLIMDTGEARSTHHIATLVSFGASAICPYLALALAQEGTPKSLGSAEEREERLIHALEMGLLKVMSKCGISVVRSYQGSMLMMPLGLGEGILGEFFNGMPSVIGGLEIEDLAAQCLRSTQAWQDGQGEGWKAPKLYLYREHNRGTSGEKHSMTNTRSKLLHQVARHEGEESELRSLYKNYREQGEADAPVNLRHLLRFRQEASPLPIEEIEPWKAITRRFGSGAMSFGAISAESQRDIILAMREISGRSNSGEGGENPYYFSEGIVASTKQVASARFGVTAEYLVSGQEIQIKICQGAKPGEGGQLMGIKVDPAIAKARFAPAGVELISPPPLHDIYSIEDLKELIYELRQVAPHAPIGVKLVAGAGVGTIAVGVAKAGAQIIQISGGDGGTGAASLSSMKHAGLPWEIGLLEAHQALAANQLRQHILLRADGGLSTGHDIVMAAILGADEMDFGKLILIAQGCVMARICEKNTCPTGIATHDPRFKAKYKGQKEHIVRVMQMLAEETREILSQLGARSLQEIIGRTDLLDLQERHLPLIKERKIDLRLFFARHPHGGYTGQSASTEPTASTEQSASTNEPNASTIPPAPPVLASTAPTSSAPALVNPYSSEHRISEMNQHLLDELTPRILAGEAIDASYTIRSTDRAAGARLAGWIAEQHQLARSLERQQGQAQPPLLRAPIKLRFQGSAGQGFGVFLTEGIHVTLEGEANDSVAKGMSGGHLTIKPPQGSRFIPEESAIIGNCALYGATGGTLYLHGRAGDRFAVRNSGATAIIEGAGWHACEYMTNGRVIILGHCAANLGAGMTGGEIIGLPQLSRVLHNEFLREAPFQSHDLDTLYALLLDYFHATGSTSAKRLLDQWSQTNPPLRRFLPLHHTHQERQDAA